MQHPWPGIVCGTVCAVLGALAAPFPVAAELVLRLATATSVENSGLLSHLLPRAERALGVRVEVLPVGSGQALEIAGRGDADIVISHSPEDEERALQRGAVVEPRLLMENEFFLVGPPSDPAGVRGGRSISAAFAAIAKRGAKFVSRGDRSGTHEMEKKLWQLAGVQPSLPWYLESGQGMGATLLMAQEREAYTLAERATFLTYRNRTGLEILVRNEPPLRNVYRVFLANPSERPPEKVQAARKLALWLVSPEGQQAIASFRPVGDEPLFQPAALPSPVAEAR